MSTTAAAIAVNALRRDPPPHALFHPQHNVPSSDNLALSYVSAAISADTRLHKRDFMLVYAGGTTYLGVGG